AAAGAGGRAERKRIDDVAAMPDSKMQMRIFGQPGQADASQSLTCFHLLPGPNLHAAAFHMAILRLPVFAVRDHDAISTFPAADWLAVFAAKAFVRNIITNAQNAAVGGGDYVDAFPLCLHRRKTKVSSVVIVVGQGSAPIVL